MAFGTPVAHEDDALRALRAAAELRGERRAACARRRHRRGVAAGDRRAPPPRSGLAARRRARRGPRGRRDVAARAPRAPRPSSPAAPSCWPTSTRRAGDPPPARSPLLGRGASSAPARAFARVLRHAPPQLLTIVGEPGIGKTRLVAELAAIAAPADACSAAAARRTARASRTGRCARSSRRRRAIARRAAGRRARPRAGRWCDQVAAAVGLGAGGRARKSGPRSCACWPGCRRARRSSLVVDDAHWPSPRCSTCCGDAAARLRDAPVLAGRGRAARPRARPGGRRCSSSGPLSPDASAALLAALDGGRLMPASAGGSPRRRAATRCSSSSSWPTSTSGRRGRAAARAPRAARRAPRPARRRRARGARARRGRGRRVRRRGRCTRSPPGSPGPSSSAPASGSSSATCSARRAGDAALPPQRSIRDVAYASLAKSARARLHERHAAWLDGLGAELPEADARIGFHLETACRYAARDRRRRAAARSRAGRRAGSRRRGVAHGRGDLPGEIGFLDRAVALLGDRRPAGRGAAARAGLGAVRGGRVGRAPRRSRSARWRRPRRWACRASARGRAIERERIRLSRHRRRSTPSAPSPIVERGDADAHRARGPPRARARRVPDGRPRVDHGRPGGLLPPRPARCSTTPARGGSGFDVGDRADVHGLVPRRGPVPRAGGDRACATRWNARRPASAPPS